VDHPSPITDYSSPITHNSSPQTVQFAPYKRIVSLIIAQKIDPSMILIVLLPKKSIILRLSTKAGGQLSLTKYV
jgi:hypothetical protein